MPVQRSIMKSRGLPSNNRHPRCSLFPAAALTVCFVAAAAAAICIPDLAFASGGISEAGQENNLITEEPENGNGMLVLEDPKEKTRYAEYRMAVGDTFSITFIHSVNNSPETDCFEIREDGIYGVKTIYYGFGAGVPTELEEGQTLTYGEDGSMIISGLDVKMTNLIYRVGTVSDHILTLGDGSEISLRELCGRNARVGFRFEFQEEAMETMTESEKGYG